MAAFDTKSWANPPARTFTKPDRPLVWFITGCSSGLGLSLVRIAQSHGHTVIATSRNPARTPDLVAEVEGKGGKWLKLDIDDPQSGKVIDDLEAQGTHVDILVNNAGWSVHNSAEQVTEDEARAQIETLYLAPYRLMRAVTPYMRKRRYGVIVNISSGAGLEGRETMAAYAAGKAALDGVTKVFAKEVADFNVRALYVTLGGFNTNMPNALVMGSIPLDADYENTMVGMMTRGLGSGNFKPDGDKQKAAKAIYEVVVGEGVGKGREAERVLPLGRDVAARIKSIAEQWQNTMEAFGEVCNNVYAEK
ncbi:NAD(P)-binding protein [Thozetella sp. PMI_491]|nr:NAD(P)-binding protein [Thozetella sp. PMI_491]